MKFAYADPPYIGQAKKHYSHDPKCQEVDHLRLVQNMCEKYDSWALSCSSPSLQEILSYCPIDVRVASWVKPFASFKPGVNPAYTWEPVVYWRPKKRNRNHSTVKDHLIEKITMKKGLSGAKPVKFCFWLFDLMGLDENDDLYDLFPGTGIVSDSWESYKRLKTKIPPKIFHELT